MSGFFVAVQRLVRRWRDPFLINRDWDEFKAMTDDELRLEYDRLLTARPMSDRFRRLCQFISLRWVNAPNKQAQWPREARSAGTPC
jgi:hypothetical protein